MKISKHQSSLQVSGLLLLMLLSIFLAGGLRSMATASEVNLNEQPEMDKFRTMKADEHDGTSPPHILQGDNGSSNTPQPLSLTVESIIVGPNDQFAFYLSVPASPTIILAYQLQEKRNVTVLVYESDGHGNMTKLVFKQVITNSNQFNQQLDLADIPSGRYYLLLYNNVSLNNLLSIRFNTISITTVAYFISAQKFSSQTSLSLTDGDEIPNDSFLVTSEIISSEFALLVSPFALLLAFIVSIALLIFVMTRRGKVSAYAPPIMHAPPYQPQPRSYQPRYQAKPSSSEAAPKRHSESRLRSDQKKIQNFYEDHVKKQPQMRNCPECNGVIASDDFFCSHCGMRLA